jgi:FxsC-like protein
MAEKRMQLTAVTIDTAHLPDGRSEQYYGRTSRQWRPYFPAAEMPIVDYAVELARYLGCQPRVISLKEHLRDAADAANAPGLFLIDVWAATSQGCCDDLRRLDELDQEWTSVLHPWNREDDQTSTANGLRESLEACLGRKLAGIPRRLQRQALEIETIEDFGDVMAPMIMAMRRRYLKSTAPRPPDPTTIDRPRLRARSDDDDEGSR